MIFIVWKSFTLSCSHFLNLKYESKCNEIHGHNYKVLIGLYSTELNDSEMVLDFSEIKRIFREKIHFKYDHKHLNSVEPFDKINPTAENMCRVFYDILKNEFPENILYGVKVYETDGSSAEYVDL